MIPVELGAAAFCLVVALGMLSGAVSALLVRRWSGGAQLRASMNRIWAHLMEFQLFADEPATILKAQRDLLRANARMLRLVAMPSLILAVPLAALLIGADAVFGHAPLRVGDAAVITIQGGNSIQGARLETPPGINAETAAVHVLSEGQASWRVRPARAVTGDLRIGYAGHVFFKAISSRPGMRWLFERRLVSPFSKAGLNWIEIRYPPATVFRLHWLIWFSIASLAGAAASMLRVRKFRGVKRFAITHRGLLTMAACLCACGTGLLWVGCRTERAALRVIVLGVDGMDPGFVERHWDALPNLAKLRDRGSFQRLGTTTPPQSPVAWSSFITGLSPAEHGIYDFVHRDPETLQPFSSMSRTEDPRWTLPLGPYVLPLSRSRVISLREGTPFWKVLAKDGIPVTVVRMPTNYPPVGVGHELAGMGTPDLRGTLGTFTFFTDDPTETSRSVPGGEIVKAHLEQGHGTLSLEGPPNTLRRDRRYATADLTLDVDPEQPIARVRVGDEVAVLREGEWSGWLAADFPLIPHLSSVRGAFRIFAKQFHPRLQLYISAINIDPMSPALPISTPPGWARALARETGRFYSMGTPEDTSALRQGVFTLAEFQSQTRLVFEDERNLLRHCLKYFRSGLLFFYFSSVDQNSHILWGKHEADLLRVYQAVDACIGEAATAFPDAALIVMSDHGFTTFDRAVNLNAWLSHRGFLTLNGTAGDDTSLSSLDWTSTEAYALGLNGLYLNRKGRELHGIVDSKEQAPGLIANLRDQLTAWRDRINGRQVVEAVYESHASPRNAAVAPDLIVGYAPGYRASWQTGLGGTPAEELDDNDDAWIGDHCINPADVPGVLFTNRKAARKGLGLRDVTALILQLFGLRPKN